ncbi:hypothetical protein PAHAL_6G147400 [Panicum hallii]|uniref:DUF7771 domain-containing protein n=1 Tax=Panicum hallii TaxID=206008 RepID=A0A2S3I296_9POAL|nr:hypothetical protein PAHAL_6G147400 [Panicum hallii]
MDKTSPQAAGLNRRLSAAVIAAAAAIAVAAITLQAPLPAAAQNQVSLKPRPEAHNDVFKGCFKKDPNGRKWPCSRINNPGANLTMFDCDIENQMGTEMYLDCDGDQRPYHFGPGERRYESYASVFDPAPPPRTGLSPRVACEWRCAGNVMTGVVVWDEQWPEAWSCREVGGDGQCRLVFESSKEVVLVTRAGRRVLGDLPIKECSKNWWGYGGWLPFGFGCTYPKHDHKYYGTVKS